jgi:rhamnulose-1-phosphate aldolase/alcohol dehydrogenase
LDLAIQVDAPNLTTEQDHSGIVNIADRQGNLMPKTREVEPLERLWEDKVADELDPVERLVYRSNLLGSVQRITNTGGGNTSSKIMMSDPITGQETDVLWVKGSGGDLRTANRANFASFELSRLESLKAIYDASPVVGVKTEIEDAMVDLYRHAVFNLNPRAGSIDTPLHAFIPHRHIDHTHPNAIIAIAASKGSKELTREIFGEDLGWVKWQRPGFDLGLLMEAEAEENPGVHGLMMSQHGLISWADDDKECYLQTLSLIDRAEEYIQRHDKGPDTFGGAQYETLDESRAEAVLSQVLPALRGMISAERRFIATVERRAAVLEFVNSHDASRLAELGTSCPDHFLRTKIKPFYVAWDPSSGDVATLLKALADGLEGYRNDYRAYYERCRHDDSPPMRDPNPTVVLIPGIGMVAWGKSKSESRVTAEFYVAAIEVMRGAEAISEYIALPEQEAFDIEYWALEEAKLRRMPPEKELARHVVVVVGGGSGIGRAVAQRVAEEGAHVTAVDLHEEAASETAHMLSDKFGVGIGVAGSGISGCGPAIAVGADITDRDSVRQMFNQVVMAYGGIDDVVVTAGLYVPPNQEGRVQDDQWKATFNVNVQGAYIVADEARRIWEAQELSGSLTLTTSVNAVVPKKGSLAYDSSKAAANHLIRELAIELAPWVRVNGVAPATVVEGSSMFPRDRVIASLTKYGIDFTEDESTETLRGRLAGFYAKRTLLKSPILLRDQAEAAFLLCSGRLAKTTGQILTVDGGLIEAFLR